jgi:hypothetical protein
MRSTEDKVNEGRSMRVWGGAKRKYVERDKSGKRRVYGRSEGK